MHCPNCGTENRPQARFCHDCGQRLPVGEPPKPRSNRALRLVILSTLACLVLAVCGLGGWWVWQEYSEQLAEPPVVGRPPASEGETGTGPMPTPTLEKSTTGEAKEVPTELPVGPPPDHSQRSLFAPIGPPFAMPNVPINKENAGALTPISFLGHGHGEVTAIKYSPDGKWLAIAGSSGITVHDAQTLAQVFAFPATMISEKNIKFNYLSFSHDGSVLFANNSAYRTPSYFGLWEIPSGALVNLGPNENILTFSPLEPFLAEAYSTIINIIDWETRESVFSFAAGGDISQLIYSPNGKYLAAVTETGIQVWNTENGELITTLSEGDVPTNVAFSPDGHYLAEAKDFDRIILWEISTQRFVTLDAEDSNPYSLIFSPDGQTLISTGAGGTGSEDRVIKVWSVEARSVIQSYEEKRWGGWPPIDFNPNTAEITTSSGGVVKFFDARSLQPTRSLPSAGRLIYSPDGTKIAHVGAVVSMWDAISMRLLWSHPENLPDTFASVSFSPDSRYAAVGGYRGNKDDIEAFGGALKIYDVASGNLLHEHHVETEERYTAENVPALAYSPDGRWLAVRSYNVMLWLDTNVQQFLPDVIDVDGIGYERAIDWQPTGSLIAAGGGEKVILIDAETKQIIKTLEGHKDGITDLAFSPDGKLLASADANNLVKLWDIEGGWELPSFTKEPGVSSSIAFSPNGEMLVSGGLRYVQQGLVQIWDIETGRQLFSVSDLNDIHVSFNPDGTHLTIGPEIWGIRRD
jgi:WD40 repeat protein